MTDPTKKPVLDEQSFEKLLEAAHVLQRHQRKMRELQERMELHSERLREQEQADQTPPPPSPSAAAENARQSDYTVTLSEIVEVQRQIQLRHLELEKAMALVAEKVAAITHAHGAAIGILDGKTVRYRAGAGASALPAGSEVPLATAICAASVRTGQVIRSEDVNTEVLFDPEPCRQRGILSLLAVPIYHDGDIVGALELYFDRIRGYAEQDIHTCQLLAGLVTEAMGRDADLKVKKSMAEERSTMLATIEKLQPNLADSGTDAPSPAGDQATVVAKATTPSLYVCWKCGGHVPGEEQFCGNCGAARVSDGEVSTVQSKLAAAVHMQQAQQGITAEPHNAMPVFQRGATSASVLRQEHEQDGKQKPEPEEELEFAHDFGHDSDLSRLPEVTAEQEEEEQHKLPLAAHSLQAKTTCDDLTLATGSLPMHDEVEGPAAAAGRDDDQVWSSAAKTRDFLESIADASQANAFLRIWRSHRGDFYLALAVMVVLVVIRWGIWSSHPVAATARGTAAPTSATQPQPPAEPDLSLFDRLLISLGLATPPEPPPDKGNPTIRVWVDLHTALYYCPGSELYGKTPDGKFTSQREAQLDQFEPAYRKPCD